MEAVYLDHAATTPVRPAVLDAMRTVLTEQFGNPSSVHRWGREARTLLETARERVAQAVGADRREIVFTSGGTEADNLAVLGRARAVRATGGRDVVAVSAVEHKAVLGAAEAVADEGGLVILLSTDEQGRVDLASLEQALQERPAVVSVQWANNETGVLQPIESIAGLCRAAGVPLHSDAVQAMGRVPVRVDQVPVDLVAISGHKLGAPKGIGALYVRSGVELVPLTHGGGQERGLRPGTENIAAIVGLGVAVEEAMAARDREYNRLAGLRDELQAALVADIPGLSVNSGEADRLPNILNISLADVEQDALMVSLDLEGIAVSSGSACQSGAVEPSHVLVAMGRAHEGAAALRISLGWTTTGEEIARVKAALPGIVQRVREFA